MSTANLSSHNDKRASLVLRLIVVVGACVLVFGLVFGAKFMGNKMMNDFIDAMPIPPATVTASPAQTMSWDNHLDAIGSLVPVNGADMTTEIGGIVTAIHFESGERVEQGRRLLTFDAAMEQGEVRRLAAQAELAELNRVRRERLFKLESISKSDYDAAVSEANAAKAALESQKAVLAKKEIRAPFAGQLGIRRVNVGEYLQPGTAIVTLQSLDPIYIDFSLPEQYVGAVQPGFKVAVGVDAFPNERFEGEVLAVEPQVDRATRNFLLRARLPNADLRLRPGQFGRVQLALPGERRVLAVPRTAINYSSFGTSVFVVQKKPADPKQAEQPKAEAAPGQPPAQTTDLLVVQRFIKLGASRGDYVAVVDGLKEGDRVATSGLLKLRNEQPVIIDANANPKVQLAPQPPQG